ncbi:hypothetical protein ACFV4Q_18095 [Streptomyces nojiriensis]|uniref:hypothetical protein n=1 Tax=Streptomyces nojiriensis TaxID=66374 RepID=UPI003648AD4A
MHSPSPATLAGLANNTACPDDVLLRLLTVPDDTVIRAVAKRRKLSQPVIEAILTHPERSVRAAFAENAYADPKQRARLMDDPSPRVHLALAMGPLPDGYAPIRPLPDHVYPRLLAHPRELIRSETLGSPSIPPHVLAALWEHEDPAFRQAACRAWHACSDTARQALLNDPDPEVRQTALLSLPHPDAEQTARLLAELDGHWKLSGLLNRAALSRDLAERLITDSENHIELAGNPTLPADLVELLATSPDPHVRLLVSARPELSEDRRMRIDHHIAPEQRLPPLTWVREGQQDPELLRRCATSAHLWLRRSAAACPALPADLIDRLAADEDFAVRFLLAENQPQAPARLLLEVYLTSTHRAADLLVRHPNFPRENLAARFCKDPDPVHRRLAFLDPDLDGPQLEALSRDPHTRDQAAADVRMSLPRLRQLLAAPATSAAAAANPGLPPADMRALLDRAAAPR